MPRKKIVRKCMFCGADLGKKIVVQRESDGKKVKCYNIGLYKNFEDGRIIAICRICYKVSFSRKYRSGDIPDGWRKIDNGKKKKTNKKIRIETIYKKLRESLKNDKQVAKQMERVQ